MKALALFVALITFSLGAYPIPVPHRVRASSAPFLTGDTLRNSCQHILDEESEMTPEAVKEGDLVFVRGSRDMLSDFFKNYHPRIKNRYRLITNNSDHDAPGLFSKYLDDVKIIKWFAANATGYSHPKLFPVPRGVPNQYVGSGSFDVLLKVAPLKENTDRPILAYMNFSIYTYPTERNLVINTFKDCSWVFYPLRNSDSYGTTGKRFLSHIRTQEEYLTELSESKFVLSPRGNGLDCYRTWESLTMGAIPIVTTSDLDSMFSELPVLIINDWKEVTEEFLNQKYEEFQNGVYNEDKIYADWWLNYIRN
jgi:hypothetical protein